MSDKSFGDCPSRNIVKNPLLSTAVTGLSIEDLTHNAVLVPVAATQGLITRSDHQIGSNIQTLGQSEHEFTNFPSGDSNTNVFSPQTTISTIPPSLDISQPSHHEKKPETSTANMSKASLKSEDEFDVNEYFARLHGTRYVSAPINSNPDQNANLAAEESLEEINLNEEKNCEAQQSLTADIAQNFSQLPTVLPHVASAVFSSFSNMLNYKRDQTPDDRTQVYQDVSFQNTGASPGFVGQDLVTETPLISEEVVKEVAPPPKEPPVCGSTNFRISTKKKYAQIPGLSSGHNFETSQKIELNPLTKNINNFFIPTQVDNVEDEPKNNIIQESNPEQNTQATYNIFSPDDTNVCASEFQPNAFNMPKENKPKMFEERLPPPPMSFASHSSISNTIPPPPMFSSQRRDGQTVKSVLPPSVARRIGSNHPVIKPATVQAISTDNIFVPTFEPASTTTESSAQAIGALSEQCQAFETELSQDAVSIPPPAQFIPQPPTGFGAPHSSPATSVIAPLLAPPSSIIAPPSKSQARLPPPPSNTAPTPQMFAPTNTTVFVPPAASVEASNDRTPSSLPPLSIFSPSPPDAFQSVPTLGSKQAIGSSPGYFSLPNIPPPTVASEPPKPLIEPPKATGAINFRMNKKKPQYYSGPIEGVGSISNSVKPILPSVNSGTFQGALFTPELPKADHNVPSSVPFDISKPAETVPFVPQYNVANSVNIQPTAFDIAQPPVYSNFDVNPVQNIQPQYNTAFDLSRPTTDSYQQEEPKETKGFGIIGSLKSKLSSIDINKIQHSVTTFFDPAYNDAMNQEASAKENAPHAPSYEQPQTNLDLFVHNVQPNQQYNYDYQEQQHAMYLNNEYYKYPNFQNQGQPSAGHCSNHHHYPSHSAHPKSYSNVSQGYPGNNSNVFQSSPNNLASEETMNKSADDSLNTEDVIPASLKDSQEMAAERKMDENVARCEPEVAKLVQSTTFIEENFATNFFDMQSSKPIETAATYAVTTTEMPEKQKREPTTSFENKTIDQFANMTIDSKGDDEDKTSKLFANKNFEEAKLFANKNFEDQQNISAYGAQNVNLFANKNEEPTLRDVENTQKINDDTKTHTFGSTMFDSKEIIIPKDSLLESLSKDDVPILGVSSVPLFGLSTILADKSKEFIQSDMKANLSDRNSSMSFFDHLQKHEDYGVSQPLDTLDRNASFSFFENVGITKQKDGDNNDKIPETGNTSVSFFENVDDRSQNSKVATEHQDKDEIAKEEKVEEDLENASELSICETCREVNKPEDREDDQDVTSQLIENITSPIQLSNPVEALLSEATTPVPTSTEQVKYDAGQFDEISHITEETIETIQVQSATELLEDVDEIKSMNYGWSNESALKEDYNFSIDPNTIGFYGNNSLFFDKEPTNADEIKHHEDLLAKQLSAPSAPPAEDEDSKSDEAGVLDVNSIEQDANKDFPLFEEFVIEPAENDDDKDFKDNSEGDLDSFTNRVEKFKNMDPIEAEHSSLFFEMPAQPINMVSYFDTGNYAVDAHYRNTNTRPAPVLSIPPGFEEEYKKRVALAKEREEKIRKEMTVVPETSTQTRTTSVITYCSSRIAPTFTCAQSIGPVGFNIEANISSLVDDHNDKTPIASRSIGSAEKRRPSIAKSDDKQDDFPSVFKIKPAEKQEKKLPDFPSTFSFKAVQKPDPNPEFLAEPIFKQEQTKESNLPKSSTAFSPKTVENTEQDPPKFSAFKPEEKTEPKLPDPINFFTNTAANDPPENFSRLASYFSSPPKTEHAKSFFELSESQNHYRHASSEQKSKILDLMKDLTSVQNVSPPAEQIVRHINFFTVEYDTVLPNFNKGDENPNFEMSDEFDKIDLNKLVTSCRYCAKILDTHFKVRTAVNENSDPGSSPSMEPRKDSGRSSVTVNFDGLTIHEEPNEGVAGMNENRTTTEYTPVKHHWFYRVDVEDKSIWRGFSVVDSRTLEATYLSPELTDQTLVPTDGGRYDVNVIGRLRIPVYWNDKPTNVRRCSWFYKGTTDARYVPYTEPVAEKLEEEYRHGMTTGEWHRRLVLPNGEVVVMHGPSVMVHFLHSDAFSTPPLFSFGKRVYRNPPKIRVSRDLPERIDHLILLVHGAGEYKCQKEKIQSSSRPRVVRRGHDESEIEDTEPSSIDHLLLLCHGVGSACDMRFRSVEEVVEDFRSTSLQLIQSHYRNSYDQGIVSRVEVLPISWHATLHSGETGVDRRLSQITLDSIPRLRSFTNDTVLDVLFYTSPVFCQTILDTVCKELNRIYALFVKRNPSFKGGISLGGHSLGSVILYDLLCHQADLATDSSKFQADKQYVNGPAGTGQPCVRYPKLTFAPDALYALGSPIAIFECIRGVESLGSSFKLPTCKNFFNIFHPYDPIAYRIEPLIDPRLRDLKPFLIPHHKGRKRMHLELKDTMARVGADLKQKLLESLKSTWNKWKAQPPTDGQLEKVVEEEIEKEHLCDDSKEELARENELATPEMLGRLNGGRRIDYVLQEAPLEMINEYLFAMSSHVGYWESEDTMLLMLREIYSALGVQPDSTVPQQNMTVQRTRNPRQDETFVLNAEFPSTSRGAI